METTGSHSFKDPSWPGHWNHCNGREPETAVEFRYTADQTELTPQLVKPAATVALYMRLHDLTSRAGKQKVQLDFQLCYAEYRASCWDLGPGQQFWKIQHTSLLLELVYFFWFEERQLARGAKMLAKVMFSCIFVAGSQSSIRQ